MFLCLSSFCTVEHMGVLRFFFNLFLTSLSSCFSVTNDRTYMMDEEILVSSSNEWCKYIKWGADEFWDSHGIYIDQVHHLFHSYRSRRFISSHVNVPYAFFSSSILFSLFFTFPTFDRFFILHSPFTFHTTSCISLVLSEFLLHGSSKFKHI